MGVALRFSLFTILCFTAGCSANAELEFGSFAASSPTEQFEPIDDEEEIDEDIDVDPFATLTFVVPAHSRTITLENQGGLTDIDWGDGSTPLESATATVTHEYAAAGTYTVTFHDGVCTSLTIQNQPLTAATGLQVLSSLRFLTLFSNQLTTFDVGQLSNTVEQLNLYNNQISTIVSASLPTSLRTLDLGMNNLAQFDATTLPVGLDVLYLDFNDLVYLDLTELPTSLYRLNFNGNPLTSYDLTQLPNSILYLDIAATNLSAIEPASLPNALETLNMSNNSLSSFDASNLPPSLEFINLQSNNIAGNYLNQILINLLDQWTSPGHSILLQNQSMGSFPSAEGANAKATLMGIGNTVETDDPPSGS